MRRTATAIALFSLTAACAAEPELPAEDTMAFTMFSRGARNANTGGGATSHADAAAAAVGTVAMAIHALMITPRLVWAGTISQRPRRDGSSWIYEKTMPLAGLETRLTVTPNGEGWDTEMSVTGLRGELTALNDFVWYRGHHSADEGNWLFFHPTEEGEALRVTWQRSDATHRSLFFENLMDADKGGGDTLKFDQDGDNLRMALHDEIGPEGEARELTVSWHAVEGHGRFDRFNGDSECWDSIANGQLDLEACPE